MFFKKGKHFRYERLYVEDYKAKKIRYGEMKAELADAIDNELEPIRVRRKEYEENPQLVDEILVEHTLKCRELAQKTILEVKEKMGFV